MLPVDENSHLLITKAHLTTSISRNIYPEKDYQRILSPGNYFIMITTVKADFGRQNPSWIVGW